MKHYFTSLLILTMQIAVGQQTQQATTCRMSVLKKDATFEITTLFFDKSGNPLQKDGKPITNSKDVFFSGSGNVLEIKNEFGADIKLSATGKKSDDNEVPVIASTTIKQQQSQKLVFDDKGIIEDNVLVVTLNKSTLIGTYTLAISVNGQPVQKKNLSDILTLKITDAPKPDVPDEEESQEETPDKPNSEKCDCAEEYKEPDIYNKSMIYYDFKCKTFYKLDADGHKQAFNIRKKVLSPNEQIQFTVKNVNRYFYDVNFESNEITYNSEMPLLFKQLIVGDSSGLLGTLLSNFNATKKLQGTGSEVKQNYDSFIKALKTFNDKYNQLIADKLQAFSACPKFKCCEPISTKRYREISALLVNVKLELSKLQLSVKEDPELTKIKKDLSANLKLLEDCEALKKEIETLKVSLDAEKDDAKKKPIQDKIDAKKKALCDKTALESTIGELKNSLKFYETIDNLQANLPTEQDVTKAFLFVSNINSSHDEFITPPIFATGNRVALAFKISPSDSSYIVKNNIMPLYNDSLYFELPVRRGYIGFSSGTFISLGNHLRNTTYTWQALAQNQTVQINDSTKYILVESGYSPQPFGFAGFGHLQYELPHVCSFGLSVGAGLTIEKNPRIGYLGGISVGFGDLKRLCFTYGIMAMQVDKLSNNLLSASVDKVPYKTNQVPITYYQNLNIGHFVSVSFTLFTSMNKSRLKSTKKK